MHAAFVSRFGMRPVDYVRGVRLTRAHADLRDADPAEWSVAAVAHRWGFARLQTLRCAPCRPVDSTHPAEVLAGSD